MIKLKIAVVGADGKMGKLICKRLEKTYHVIKITERNKLKKCRNLSLVIDFADADSSVNSAKWCASEKIPLIIGSTGQTESQNEEIQKCSNFVPILKCSNFSQGIQIIFQRIADFLNDSINDISIIETHGKNKKDSPSGTANDIYNILTSCTNKKIQILSERAGSGFGTHTLRFYYANEMVEITHTAFSREVFVDGLEQCIEPMIKMKVANLYSFKEINKK